jgi:predicted GNAT family N-acyltransferase
VSASDSHTESDADYADNISSSQFASLYEAERKLRDNVLLLPYGLPAGAWEMHDDICHHLIALCHTKKSVSNSDTVTATATVTNNHHHDPDSIEVVGCVLFRPLASGVAAAAAATATATADANIPQSDAKAASSPRHGQLMQMAVSKKMQGCGIGRQLVHELERRVGELYGDGRIFCHARAYASEFYTKLGFSKVGQPFQEVGMEHFIMEKQLNVNKDTAKKLNTTMQQ